MLHSVHVLEQRQHGQIPQSGQRVNHISQVSQICSNIFSCVTKYFYYFPPPQLGLHKIGCLLRRCDRSAGGPRVSRVQLRPRGRGLQVSTGQYLISTVSILSIISTDTCPVLTRGSAPHHSSTARITWSRTRATEGPLSSPP